MNPHKPKDPRSVPYPGLLQTLAVWKGCSRVPMGCWGVDYKFYGLKRLRGKS